MLRVKTLNQRISRTNQQSLHEGACNRRIELDSHADAFVAGRNCMLMHYTERVCDGMPYSDEYEPKSNTYIVQVATSYTTACSKRCVLIFNEALHILELEHSLMNPNQLRNYGIEVQDNPHSSDIMVVEKTGDEQDFITCLQSEEANIFIDTWTPIDKHLKEHKHVVFTSPTECNPNKVKFPGTDFNDANEIESRNISLVENNFRGDDTLIPRDNPCLRPIRMFDIQSFNRRMMKSSIIETKMAQGPSSEDEILPPKTFLSTNRHSNAAEEDLNEVFQISVEQAQMTLDATTQHHIRSAIMPLSRRC